MSRPEASGQEAGGAYLGLPFNAAAELALGYQPHNPALDAAMRELESSMRKGGAKPVEGKRRRRPPRQWSVLEEPAGSSCEEAQRPVDRHGHTPAFQKLLRTMPGGLQAQTWPAWPWGGAPCNPLHCLGSPGFGGSPLCSSAPLPAQLPPPPPLLFTGVDPRAAHGEMACGPGERPPLVTVRLTPRSAAGARAGLAKADAISLPMGFHTPGGGRGNEEVKGGAPGARWLGSAQVCGGSGGQGCERAHSAPAPAGAKRPAPEGTDEEVERELRAELLREVSREQAARAALMRAETLNVATEEPRAAAGGVQAGGVCAQPGAQPDMQLQGACAKLATRPARQRKAATLRRLQDEVSTLREHNRELSASLGDLLARAESVEREATTLHQLLGCLKAPAPRPAPPVFSPPGPRGFTVEVFEQRAQPSTANQDPGGGRTYLMILNGRALQALQAAGADPPCCSEAQGAARRAGLYDMSTGRLFPHRTGRAHIVDRRTLGAELVAEAQRLHPSAVTFHFECGLQDIDFQERVASFAGPAGARGAPVAYDLLVGADGANSAVRRLMQERCGLPVSVRLRAGMRYKTFHGLAPLAGEDPVPASSADAKHSAHGSAAVQLPDMRTHRPREYTYSWFRDATGRGRVLCSTWLGDDGRISGLLASYEDLPEAEQAALLAAALSSMPPAWRAEVARQTGAGAQAPAAFGAVVVCARFHGPRAALVGDAAHAVTSTLGQGCNLALESCRALDAALGASACDLDAAPELYSDARVADAHAFQELEVMQACVVAPREAGCLPRGAALRARAVMYLALLAGSGLAALRVLPSPMYLGPALADPALPQAVILRNVRALALLGALLLALVLTLALQTQAAGTQDAEVLQRFANHVQNMDDALAAAGLVPWAGSVLNVCQWGGVTCAAGTTRVVNVSIPGFGLRGSLSAELASLSELRVLNLANNQLTGTLPPAFGGSLRHLQELDLSGNPLQGQLPREWFGNASFPELRQLVLSFGPLGTPDRTPTRGAVTGQLPDVTGGALPRLQTLIVRDERVAGTLPAGYAHALPRLQVLSLSGLLLGGSLPDAWADWGSLRQLALYSNEIVGTLPLAWGKPGALKSLQLLNIWGNLISGTLPASWGANGSLGALDSMYISQNMLRGRVPSEWGQGSFAPLRELLLMSSGGGNGGLCGAVPRGVPAVTSSNASITAFSKPCSGDAWPPTGSQPGHPPGPPLTLSAVGATLGAAPASPGADPGKPSPGFNGGSVLGGAAGGAAALAIALAAAALAVRRRRRRVDRADEETGAVVPKKEEEAEWEPLRSKYMRTSENGSSSLHGGSSGSASPPAAISTNGVNAATLGAHKAGKAARNGHSPRIGVSKPYPPGVVLGTEAGGASAARWLDSAPAHMQARHRKLLMTWVDAAADAESLPPSPHAAGATEPCAVPDRPWLWPSADTYAREGPGTSFVSSTEAAIRSASTVVSACSAVSSQQARAIEEAAVYAGLHALAQAVVQHAELPDAEVGRLLLRDPTLAQYSEDVVARGAAVLRDRLACGQGELAALVRKHPLALAAPPARVEALIGFLQDLGMGEPGALRMVRLQPQLLSISLKGMARHAAALLSMLGLHPGELQRLVARCPTVLASSPERNVRAKLDCLIRLGVPPDELGRVVRTAPSILTLAAASIEAKVTYLATVGLTPTRSPACLLYSLDRRVRPRVEFLQESGARVPGTHEFLSVSDAEFCKRFGKCEPERYAAYLAARGVCGGRQRRARRAAQPVEPARRRD
ncbi:hypothetical protein WJX81_000631 [Elliptochloris bilobata]|uniref:Uncharacterized protein n=1 Tax=Elliptochloris bilobata TaxID=381761 RepID=A0AAW1RVC9_9CHLO